MPEKQLATRIRGNDVYPVPYRQAIPPESPRARYPGFKPGATVLKKGTVRREGAAVLPCDIVFERDVPLKLRDGVTIYTDVFRPVGKGRFPALVAWGPYGKEIGGQWLDDLPHRAGVPLGLVSELQKFEGPDPAFWVNQGYVVLNPDARGAYMSEGNISFWGRQLAEDGYDFIEWAAQQPWCCGKIGMSGNSWLTVSQWFIAAERPPHLAAIAPWEGFVDHFREAGTRGGIPTPQFCEMIIQTFAGKGLVEDLPRMIVDQPLISPYWEDKTARLERIEIPAYVVASYTNPVHTHGTFEGFRRIASKDKWLRVHNTQEWVDYYAPEHVRDLLRFFDRYLKGADNGWEKTPRVRLSVLDPGGRDLVDRPEREWPLARTQFRKLCLGPDGSLGVDPVAEPATLGYDVEGEGRVSFTHTFDKDIELTGYMSLHMWVEAEGSDDMELVVTVEKVDRDGKPIPAMPGAGPGGLVPITALGVLRVSQRALDPERSTPSEPYLLHTSEERLSPGQIVPVDVPIWPMGMRFAAGETLCLTVSAYRPFPEMYLGFGAARGAVPASGGTFRPGEKVKMLSLGGTPDTSPAYAKAQQVPTPAGRNKGRHIIHVGKNFDSHLLLPEVPPAS